MSILKNGDKCVLKKKKKNAKIVFYNFNQHKLITYLINNRKINLNNKCKPMYGAF